MSIQLNLGDHTSSEAEYQAFPSEHRGKVKWARSRAKVIAKTIPSADVYFRALPGGRSLRELLEDASIWVNFSPTMPYYGETNAVGGKEIAISGMACKIGRWTVLATLIHELAHADGAPGGADKAAERALPHCGLGKRSELKSGTDDPWTPFNPNISG